MPIKVSGDVADFKLCNRAGVTTHPFMRYFPLSNWSLEKAEQHAKLRVGSAEIQISKFQEEILLKNHTKALSLVLPLAVAVAQSR